MRFNIRIRRHKMFKTIKRIFINFIRIQIIEFHGFRRCELCRKWACRIAVIFCTEGGIIVCESCWKNERNK